MGGRCPRPSVSDQAFLSISIGTRHALEVVAGYDRGGLISKSINTVKHSLLEEAIIAFLVIIGFLFHFRAALIPILALPIALVISFIPTYCLNVSSNIMCLGGLALAIGVLVDAAIVMGGERMPASIGAPGIRWRSIREDEVLECRLQKHVPVVHSGTVEVVAPKVARAANHCTSQPPTLSALIHFVAFQITSDCSALFRV